MIILDYQKKYHKKIIAAAVSALKSGKAVVYPTDTSYGLAVDATNTKAVKKLYQIKGRNFHKPVHVIAPSLAYGKKITQWNQMAEKLVQKFWPGPLTLVLSMKVKNQGLKILSAGSNTIGLRMPKNKISIDLAKELGHPITATSANVSGKPDCYSIKDAQAQFKSKKYQPDIIINFGFLPKRKPSTIVKIAHNQIVVLRPGPITEKEIQKCF